MELLNFIASFVFVLALIAAGAWILRVFVLNGRGSNVGKLFAVTEKRIGVVEAASIDSRRKLVLIHRDNVEHLILTGGPVDVVVETGIPRVETSLEEQNPATPKEPTKLSNEKTAQPSDKKEQVFVARRRDRLTEGERKTS